LIHNDSAELDVELKIINPNRFEIWIDKHFARRVQSDKDYDGVVVSNAIDTAMNENLKKKEQAGINDGICNYLTLNIKGFKIINKAITPTRGSYILRGPKGQEFTIEAKFDERYAIIKKHGKNEWTWGSDEKFDLADPSVDQKIRDRLLNAPKTVVNDNQYQENTQ
jgi:hypothetical protein